MDTIDGNAMQRAAERVIQNQGMAAVIHTVTITLNGQHGGVDVILEGTTDGGDLISRTVRA